MATNFNFTVEDDPVPIVLMFNTMLQHALLNPAHASIARSIEGSFALSSTTDPQSLTINIDGNNIHLRHGISKQAKIIIHLDFNNMDEGKPSVEGLFRHPSFAYKVGKLLDFPKTNWADEAKRFWDRTHEMRGMPACIKIICTDESRELELGEAEAELELTGEAKHLASLFSGSSMLITDVMSGKISILGSLEHLTILSEATLNSMLGGHIDG